MADESRAYYPNGALRCVRPLLDGVPHGIHHEWYPNGVLKEETPWDHGIINGTVKYWNDKGELLGASELKNGTGILRYWVPDQQMYGETSYVDGKWTGRWVGYLAGELSYIQYWLENKKVSRKRYEAACQKDPRLPRFGDDRELGPTWLQTMKKKGRIKPEKAREPKQSPDERTQKILQRPDAVEALSWLKERRDPPRWLGEATDQDESIDFVERLYRLGAVKIQAAKIDGDPHVGHSASLLVVELPDDKAARRKLLRVCGKLSEKLGFDPTRDTGQRYQLLMLD
jgi:hypothetical protein